jgi:hypothetical protein
MSKFLRILIFVLLATCTFLPARPPEKPVWKSVSFAIVKLNDGPPISWNMYHAEKRGQL